MIKWRISIIKSCNKNPFEEKFLWMDFLYCDFYKLNKNLSVDKTLGRCPNTPRFFEKNRVKLLVKYRDESHGIFDIKYKFTVNKSFSLVEKVSRSDGWGDRFLYKVLIKRIKFNFSQMEKWDLQGTFLSQKFPAPSKISLRPHIPCASGNRLYNVYGNRYRIYGLKAMQRRFFWQNFWKNKS